MKNIFIIFFLLAGMLCAQTIYEVQPNTKGNVIILNLVNESAVEDAGTINVTLQKEPGSLVIKNFMVQLRELKKGEEKEAKFIFDVKRIPAALKDTLRFRINSERGESWQKEIILAYTLPTEFKLEQNYPNPFNPVTTIEFSLPKGGKYQIQIYNILGEVVKELVTKEFEAGYHQAVFDAKEFASGAYFYTLTGDDVRIVKKMMLLK